MTSLLPLLQESNPQQLFSGMLFGIERECLRIDKEGKIANTSHPESLGHKLTHPYITTDYAEFQLEFPSAAYSTRDEVLAQLLEIHAFTLQSIAPELLWPMSMPARLPEKDSAIPISRFGSSNDAQLKELYRIGIGLRYGRRMQTISGIHYNLSFSDSFWQQCFQDEKSTESWQSWRDERVFGLLRNFLREFWISLYLFGVSPVFNESFLPEGHQGLQRKGDYFYGPYATTLRMSEVGYSNAERCKYCVSHNSLLDFIIDLQEATKTPCPTFQRLGLEKSGVPLQISYAILQIENEYYVPIRPKQTVLPTENRLSDALRNRGVGYIELRSLDCNPWHPLGIDPIALDFMTIFSLYCCGENSDSLSCEEQGETLLNQRTVALEGRKPLLTLSDKGKKRILSEWGGTIVNKMYPYAELLNSAENTIRYTEVLHHAELLLEDSTLTPSARLLADVEKKGNFIHYGLDLASQHQDALKTILSEEALQRQKNLSAESIKKATEKFKKTEIPFANFLQQYR